MVSRKKSTMLHSSQAVDDFRANIIQLAGQEPPEKSEHDLVVIVLVASLTDSHQCQIYVIPY